MLFLGTTSLNRPNLHTQMFKINDFFFRDCKVDICWIINIDVIDRIPFTYEETKENYIKCIKNVLPKCNIIFIEKKETPSFTMAAKNISSMILSIIKPEDSLLWFEDDWANLKNKTSINKYIKYMNDKDGIIRLIKKPEYLYCFYPLIRGYNYAVDFLNAIQKVQDNAKDPEISVRKLYNRGKAGQNIIKKKDVKIEYIFDDMGRKYLRQYKIKKIGGKGNFYNFE